MKLIDYGLFQMYKTMGVFGMNYDVQESESEITFSIGVPGLRHEDMDIRIRNNQRLILKSLKSTKYTPDFYYAFVLPCEVNKEETYAVIEDGVLTIVMKKKEPNEFKVSLK